MVKKKDKVIFDANIFLSFFLTSGPTITTLFNIWQSGFIQLFASPEIIAEIKRVSEYPKLQKYLTDEDKRRLFIMTHRMVKKSYPKEKISFPRDQGDSIYLEAAVSCGADYILTGDRDLLDLEKYKNIIIISPSEFIKLISTSRKSPES